MTLASILALLSGIASVGGFIWFWGYNRNRDNMLELRAAKKQAELEAKDAKRTAEIFSLPRGDKSDVIDKL